MINTERLLENFLELVSIDSTTFHEREVVDFLFKRLRHAVALGSKMTIDDAGEKIGGDTGNLIVSIPGQESYPTLAFNAHLDTVEPGKSIIPKIDNDVIKSDGDTILGADDKVGVAAILEMALTILENGERHPPVKLIFTVAEEKGLLGAKNLDPEVIKADQVFVLDSVGTVGEIIVKAPFQNSIYVKFTGKAAHSGINPEAGVNSIKAAALAISNMDVGRIDDETTANIGVIKGGSAINVVPELTEIKAEVRSLSETSLENKTKSMVKALKTGSLEVGTDIDIEVVREYDGFDLYKDDEVIKVASVALRHIGLNASLRSTGGGSDTNVFNSMGMSTVALGVGYLNPHTTEESIAIVELINASKLAQAITMTVSKK